MTDQDPDTGVTPDPQADAALRALFVRADAASAVEAGRDTAWSAAVMARVAAEAAARQRRLDIAMRVGGALTALSLAAALPFAPPAFAYLAASLPDRTGLTVALPDAGTLLPALSIATATACLAAVAILTRPTVGER